MCDGIGSSSVCFDFRSTNVVQPSNWKYVVNDRLNDSLSLDPNLYYYPLITNLTFFQELPKRISTEEEAEILQLLCKVHELEIAKVEMQRDAILKEHEVRKRDLLILKYDKQRTLCDEIIDRQRELIEGKWKILPRLYKVENIY